LSPQVYFIQVNLVCSEFFQDRFFLQTVLFLQALEPQPVSVAILASPSFRESSEKQCLSRIVKILTDQSLCGLSTSLNTTLQVKTLLPVITSQRKQLPRVNSARSPNHSLFSPKTCKDRHFLPFLRDLPVLEDFLDKSRAAQHDLADF